MTSLWPEFDKNPPSPTPLGFVREQAIELGKQFNNKILGEVRVEQDPRQVLLTFYICAPTLSYKLRLFRLRYGFIEIYPASLVVDGDIAVELTHKPDETMIPIANEDELSHVVGKIFGSKKTVRVVSALRQHLQQ